MRLSRFFTTILTYGAYGACGLLAVIASPEARAQNKEKNAPAPKIETQPATPYSDVKRDNLLNGLKVITLERPGDAVVKCDLVIRTGAMFDLVGKTGMAALTQATLLAVNPRLKEEVESLEAKIDWGIDWDTTWFHVETPAKNFDTVFEILARLLVAENIRAEAFKVAQAEQLDKIRTQTPTLSERADAAFLKAIYGDHPYGHNIIGDQATVAAIKQGDIYDFLKRFYIANNVSISMVGPINQDRAMKSFRVFFGGWIKGQLIPTTFRPPAQVKTLRVIKIEDAQAPMIELRGGAVGLKHTDADFLVTEVMAKILSARFKSETASLTAPGSEPATTSAPRRILSGPFWFSASAQAEKAPELSSKATEQMASLATSAPSTEELAAAKSTLSAEYAARPVEYFLREIEVYALPRNYPLGIQKKIESIGAADIQRIAKKLLDANALTVVAAGRVSEAFKSTP
jgi:zinc protease